MRHGLSLPDIFATQFQTMRKFITLTLCCAILLSACIETGSTTTINNDGSGNMVAKVDLSEMMKMMAGSKRQEERFLLDTLVSFRDYSDTASWLSARQKQLLKEMKLKILMDARNGEDLKFEVSIMSPFKSLADFNELNELMKQKEYDAVFDKAMDLPMFSNPNKDPEGKKQNDNIFASVFPVFYKYTYTKGAIVCSFDKARHQQAVEDLAKSDFDLNGELESKMFGGATFTNRIVLPGKATRIDGSSLKQGAVANELVQTGNILDLYRNPEKYEYNIQY